MTHPASRPNPASVFGAGKPVEPQHPTSPLLTGRLRDLLAGKTIMMTGVTGFIGEHLLWKILTELPDTKTAVLVRRKGSADAVARMTSLLNKPMFADAVAAAGGVEALLAARINVVQGDLPNVPELPRDIDVFVHCAGDVSFDPPIDQAFSSNTVGTLNLLNRLLEASSDADGNLIRRPHYVHVSTAYTAGRRRGAIPEAEHSHDVDYVAETAAGLGMRELLEAQSRTAAQLTQLRRAAEREHRQAGYLTTAADTERRRLEWVRDKLVDAGTERARSLGWTDVYTFTKALGERVVTDVGAPLPVSIVRPAIVESALRHPEPGWIEGFKMAEPLILAYGRGQLPEFPASPDAVVDVIPVDLVVNGIVAVCATEPKPGSPRFYHQNSGARNPLTFRELYEHVRQYFLKHPFIGEPELPEWQFPGATSVARSLAVREKALAVAEWALRYAPRSELSRRAGKELDRAHRGLEFLQRYLGLYNEYAQSELHFVDDNTLRLHQSLHPDDIAAFGFDSASFDWHTYMQDIHCPSVTSSVRRLDALKRKRGNRPRTYAPLKPAAEAGGAPVLAAFDLDGTVMATNVIETYLWSTMPGLDPIARVGEFASLVAAMPNYLYAERRDRGAFLRAVYRRYAGTNLAELERFVDEQMAPMIAERVSQLAVQRIAEHRSAGHTTILMTGAIRPLTRPLAELFDIVVAADLDVDENGRCTGFLTGPPMVGESRSAWLRHYADLHGVDLSASYAYADSHVDLPMLSAVGHPVVVSPDVAPAK